MAMSNCVRVHGVWSVCVIVCVCLCVCKRKCVCVYVHMCLCVCPVLVKLGHRSLLLHILLLLKFLPKGRLEQYLLLLLRSQGQTEAHFY